MRRRLARWRSLNSTLKRRRRNRFVNAESVSSLSFSANLISTIVASVQYFALRCFRAFSAVSCITCWMVLVGFQSKSRRFSVMTKTRAYKNRVAFRRKRDQPTNRSRQLLHLKAGIYFAMEGISYVKIICSHDAKNEWNTFRQIK
jgi:hypothetical protein